MPGKKYWKVATINSHGYSVDPPPKARVNDVVCMCTQTHTK